MTDDLATIARLESRLAEAERENRALRLDAIAARLAHAEAVEAAYREGWIDGCAEYDPGDRVRDWLASEAKASLERGGGT